MKVAHLVKVTPDKICGLYNTTWELASGLRDLGVDSTLVETDIKNNPHFPKTDGQFITEHLGVPLAFTPWIHEADVIVSHSGYGDEVKQIATEHQIPIVYCAHGRPQVSYLTEKTGGLPLYSYFYTRNKQKDWAAAVTFWPEHVKYLQAILPDIPVSYVPTPCDLSFWQPGETDYTFNGLAGFKGLAGETNIVIADAWREDKDPFDALNYAILYARENPGTKVHVYGKPRDIPGAGALMRTLQDEGNLGYVPGEVSQTELRDAYRAADFGLTCNPIATRTYREMASSGLDVYYIDHELNSKLMTNEISDSKKSAEVMKQILEEALNG